MARSEVPAGTWPGCSPSWVTPKTSSLGEADDKRFYLKARRIILG